MTDNSEPAAASGASTERMDKLFALYLETAEKVSERRAKANAWMLTINTALTGAYLQIPLLETLHQIDCRRRLQAVAEAEGVNANELAQRLGVHRRTIQRMRQALRTRTTGEAAPARPAADPRQMDLFDPPAEE